MVNVPRWPALVIIVLTVLAPFQSLAQSSPSVVYEQDVIYGRVGGAALLADLAYPVGGESLPVIMYVHGGRWFLGARTGNVFNDLLDVVEWAERGFFAITIDYRLLGSSPAPAPYEDVQCAIRWLHAHAAQYGIDPERIYLIGDSAGGHLVSLAATLGDGPFARTGGWEDASNDVRAVISAAGAYDLNALDWGELWAPHSDVADSAERQLSEAGFDTRPPWLPNRRLSGDAETLRQLASPLHHVSGDTKPILVIHSDDDFSVPVQQALDMVRALDDAGVHHRFVHYTDRGHMAVTDEVIQETLDFIAEVENR